MQNIVVGTKVLLAFQRTTNRFVHIAEIVSVECDGVWVKYPRNSESVFMSTAEFDAAFCRIIAPKLTDEQRWEAAGYDFLTRARFRKFAAKG